jgi:predicted nuclease with TOPRIM domain
VPDRSVVKGSCVRVICSMEDLMVQLETARQERVQTLKEFMRLKNELVRAQRRCDELRLENGKLKEALLVAENEVQSLHSYAAEILM